MPAGCLYYTSYELSKERLDQAMPGYTVTVRDAQEMLCGRKG